VPPALSSGGRLFVQRVGGAVRACADVWDHSRDVASATGRVASRNSPHSPSPQHPVLVLVVGHLHTRRAARWCERCRLEPQAWAFQGRARAAPLRTDSASTACASPRREGVRLSPPPPASAISDTRILFAAPARRTALSRPSSQLLCHGRHATVRCDSDTALHARSPPPAPHACPTSTVSPPGHRHRKHAAQPRSA